MNLVIKGLIIGIGKILPGIAGAMLAMMIGEYERIIYSISMARGSGLHPGLPCCALSRPLSMTSRDI